MTRRAGWIDLALIVVAALGVHGLLLLDTGIYFDDWVVYTYVVKNDWELLTSLVRERGIAPVEAYFWWMFRGLPIFAYKAAVFVMIVWMAWLATAIARTTSLLARQDALLVALFIICYSGFQSWVLFCTAHYVFFYCLFLTGVWLAFRAEEETGRRHWARRGAALVLFATSYGLNSLLVLTVLFAVLLLLHIKRLKKLSIVRTIGTYLPRRLDYFLLPVLYWLAVKGLLPAQGLLTGYNEFVKTWAELDTAMRAFGLNSIVTQVRLAADELVRYPVLAAAAIAAGILLWVLSRKWEGERPAGMFTVLLIGIAGLAAAMLPYALVGKPAAAVGWSTRHALLVSFPLGIIAVALARAPFFGGSRRASVIGTAAVVALCAGMTVSTIKVYLDLHVRAIKDRSVLHQLAAMPLARDTSVFWVQDNLPQPFSESYRYFEWGGMFESIFGDQKRIGFDRQVYWLPAVLTTDRKYFIPRYRVGELDPAGCQAVLTIDWGSAERWGLTRPPRRLHLVRKYHRLRLLGDTERLNLYLGDVTRVSLEPLKAAEATNCAARP